MANKKNTSAKGHSAPGGKTTRRKTASGTRTSAAGAREERGKPVKKTVQAAGRAQQSANPAMNAEIFCWVLLAVAVFLFISTIGYGGPLGSAAADLIFGLLGTNAYVFPFMIFGLTIFMMANKGNTVAVIRTLSAAGLFLVMCAILQLLLIENTETHTLREYYQVGAEYHQGGGLVGGGIVSFFAPSVGIAGTWIVLLIAVFILTALITQKTLFLSAGKKGSETYAEAKEKTALLREEHRARRESEREAKRLQREADAAAARAQQAKALNQTLRESALASSEDNRQEAQNTSPVFFSVLKKDGAEKAGAVKNAPEHDGPLFTTDLFGESKSKKSRSEKMKMPSIRPGDVIFSKLENLQEAKEAADSYEKAPAVSPEGKTAPQEPDTASSITGSEDSSPGPVSDAGLLPPTFVIHRAESGADTDTSEEELPEDEDPAGYSPAPVVTADDIEKAGVSQIRKNASPEKKTVSSEADTKLRGEGRSSMTPEETQEVVDSVAQEIGQKEEEVIPYVFPSISLLEKPPKNRNGISDDTLRETAAKLQQILATFGVNACVTNVSCGPSVTRYELLPEMGTKVSKIVNLADDIKLNLAAADIRIEAPIPGKAAVGIEVPNKETSMVYLRELIDSEEFRKQKSKIAYVVGKDIAGRIVVSDIAKMPHLLIAGATGSGKSVFINTLIMSVIFNADPSEVKMIMIDPKVVELSVYNGIPHLFIPVVTDPKKAAGALNWAVAEMTRRYQMFAEVGVRNLSGYNVKVDALIKDNIPDPPKKMSQIVIIVDELADLMMVCGSEVEDAICRLAQLARACGIHLVIATQRPSVDVITGLIKANIPSRIAFAVSSGTDSRTILDMNGAEKLLGNGDMLFSPQTYKKPVRVQGAFVSDEEIQRVVDEIRIDDDTQSARETMKKRLAEVQMAASSAGGSAGGGDMDELFAEAGRFIIQKDKASIGMLQRWFKIGFNRAARIMDQLSDAEVVGPDEGTKPRKVLMSEEQFENYLEQN